MSEVVTTIAIAAPRADVWALCMDPDRLADWVTIHRKLHAHSDGPLRTGSTMKQRLCLRGVSFDVSWELDACRAPEHAEWHGRGPARSRAETEYRLEDDGDGGTLFHYRNSFKAPGGPLGAVASRALVGGLPQREADASLKRLKALAEQS